MLVIQRMLSTPTSVKVNVAKKIPGKELGYCNNGQLNVFQKEGTLFYTKLKEFPGWTFIKEVRVFNSQNRWQAVLVQAWIKIYMKELTHMKVYYTYKGIFIKAYRGDEFDKMFKED